MPAAFLPDRALIRVAGADAEHFLQNLITTDIEAIGQNEAWPGALLTPQGKILFDFLVWRDGNAFLIETTAAAQEALIRRLSMYKLRAAVEISVSETQGVIVFWGEDAAADDIRDMRFAAAGVTLLRRAGQHAEAPPAGYHALRILNGIVESGFDFELQDAFPHDVLLDLNRGVSFKKGCYVGQEVVSRMQHRGTARRRVVIVSAEEPLPATGTAITSGGKPVGQLGTVAGNRGLAIVRTDRVGDALAANTEILAGDTTVSLSLPAWSGLSFPTTTSEEA
ncbi:folate-binding protein YgfZ [Agrobacterium sp. a22-2]|uniref:CAF17-like 4Fe-4S cluster assembly/insertion protein YgfZ n=1 Tax=Agrobacterium sp. a22-2 TaxID=2283840 RepID=UPI0014469D86|nr:folate-binding protein YgfZ [Agrobacterium sp. a22-2]NKN37957.1 folate-binding protein YgfZ [Agrobacterium sp. a22-2]